jgi:hypothetical protein
MTSLSWIDELVQQFGFWRPEHVPWSLPREVDFQELEQSLGGRLPVEYRYFLGKYGEALLGNDDSYVRVAIVESCPWGEGTRPECFYPLLRGHPDDLREHLLTYAGRVPDGVLAMAPDAGGNQVCLDVAGEFPGSVWFWDHEQRWFTHNLQEAADELDAAGLDTRRLSVHGIVRAWARRHAERFDRPPDYMGMYRIAPSFAAFLRALHQVPY